ncbi:unnamed protein product [Rotaria sordida]|uniref:Uncharacterized protein n=1 Tax=Rotaria sordida TaxID=392033 RepID=A0A819V9M5_9BILA|nr:unnamed protein product [Rotaria sordida]
MAYTPRFRDDQNQARQNYPTISNLVKPQDNTYQFDRQTTDSPYTNRRPIDNRYPSEIYRTPYSTYDGTKRPDDYRYPSDINRTPYSTYDGTKRPDDYRYPSDINRTPYSTCDGTRRPDDYRYPSDINRTPYSTCDGTKRPDDYRYPSDINRTPYSTCDGTKRPDDNRYPIRHSYPGNARSCAMEINIKINTGGSGTSQGPYATQNYTSKSPDVRSQATIDNVRYITLHLQSPQNTARIATDGIINRFQ